MHVARYGGGETESTLVHVALSDTPLGKRGALGPCAR
jgi:hypothetical protein